MSVLTWIILGFFAGWLASIITHSTRNTLSDIILGMAGAVVGGILMSLLGQPSVSGFHFYTLIVSVLGSIVLIWFGRILNSSQPIR